MSIPSNRAELLEWERWTPIQDRIEKYSSPKDGGCIEWIGGKDSWGYGRIKVGPYNMGAHKVAALLSGMVVPAGYVVMHSCDNPACINPEHLSVGTQSDNIKDCVDKGRHPRCGHVRPSSRKVAQMEGAKTYEGKFCEVHGTCTRKTNNGACVGCAEDYRMAKQELRKQSRKG